jgi:hypothetical protein
LFIHVGRNKWKWKNEIESDKISISVLKFCLERIHELASGLPDGLFSNQKSKFGYILDGLAMEEAGIF